MQLNLRWMDLGQMKIRCVLPKNSTGTQEALILLGAITAKRNFLSINEGWEI